MNCITYWNMFLYAVLVVKDKNISPQSTCLSFIIRNSGLALSPIDGAMEFTKFTEKASDIWPV